MTTTAFSSLSLPSELVDNLSTLGYSHMTPVQAQSLPPVLEGKDIAGLESYQAEGEIQLGMARKGKPMGRTMNLYLICRSCRNKFAP